MLKNIINNEIILQLVEKDIPVELRKNGFVIEGFYKSGQVRLEPKEDGTFIAHSRYDQKDDIESFDDLVHLNHEWWGYSKDRSEGWKKPEEKWAVEMVRLGLVKRREEKVVHYE
ncbi:hypothetical protein CVD28_00945 [Bacillus sp. M6-12]|uniref:hypothetical protein n=1 Tax=Bacillus sp. M6-12 TaxID=2054166 RepID=UPI000C784918|nr:hypothetical protein [Bacillus sp. M6-12]PLS19000.1 hypothetical protein CVD28_00945 [Bacillus sp. M6-12]